MIWLYFMVGEHMHKWEGGLGYKFRYRDQIHLTCARV
jgi:hypothetical protein